ncbi:ankyrin repeat domain-containing protein [Robertkochia solimangrovi]|uniref:ankyrin repeat domain-containing protein n=1 Tax=Robertkochia solimangrovi TaxID=2213046 RepID=UPI00117C09A5|nr:ankyrin repeat domain-containing protein [Robertkochia solimangrovi]TRZ41173.1 ankyrin repeat domain-containing protein [Robertkochia solimangrovi]
MKNSISLLLLLFCTLLAAQNSNIFYNRDFWKKNPGVERIKKEIKAGNDPVALNPNAFDAIVYASLEGAPLESIKYLLSLEGNSVNKITHDGRSYLIWAAYAGNLPLVEYLIEKGSDVTIEDDHGYNALTFAANAGQQDTRLYDVLIKSGIDVKSVNRSGANALLLVAPSLEDDKLISYFTSKGISLNSTDENGNNIFNYAARKGNTKLMDLLISKGVNYKTLNKENGNAVLFAAMGGRGYSNPIEVYDYLAKLGLQTNVVTTSGRTPLHYVAGNGSSPAIVQYFLDAGVDPKQKDDEGNTALLAAARAGNLEVVKMLLPLAGDIDQANKDGVTPLAYSVMRNNGELFDMLIRKGAQPNLRDAKGNSLAGIAFNSFNKRNAETFEHILGVLKVNGADFKDVQENGNNLFHLAVLKQDPYLITKAARIGISPNEKNNEGLTALHLAAMKAGNPELISLVLNEGGDKEIRTDFEESAYDLAMENEMLTEFRNDLSILKIN